MALRVDKPGRKQEYVLIADRESSKPTKFMIRPLTWEEMAEILELAPMTMEQAVKINAIVQTAKEAKRALTAAENQRIGEIAPQSALKMTKQHALALRYGVSDILGLEDLDGNPLSMTSLAFARHASAEVINEIGAEILRISQHSEDAIKN